MKAKASGRPAKFEATPREGEQGRAQPARQVAEDDGEAEQEAEDGAAERRGDADLDADQVGVDDRGLREVRDIVEGEVAVGILERADDQEARRQDQEHDGEDEERHDAEPGPGPCRARRPRRGGAEHRSAERHAACGRTHRHGRRRQPDRGGDASAVVDANGRRRDSACGGGAASAPPQCGLERGAAAGSLHVRADDLVPLLGDLVFAAPCWSSVGKTAFA